MTTIIQAHEAEILNAFRARGTESDARRAAILLLSGEGKPAAEVAAAVGSSPSWVYQVRRAWNERGMEMFESPEGPAWVTDRGGVAGPRLPLTLAATVGILPDDPMCEAGRKALLFHFERMLLHEPGSRTGEDLESVHDMRVATRRMRSALRLSKPFFARGALGPYSHRLREIARVLGTVRDLDVLIDKAARFNQKQPELDLSPIVGEWDKARLKARRKLIRALDSRKFARFVRRFHKFLTTPGAGAPREPGAGEPAAYQVRQVVPRIIYAHYEQVRAYETALPGASLPTLHALRIEFKRLRYALEFFREVLGSEATNVIELVKTLQDHLGDLHDAVVAGDLLRAYIDAYNAEYSGVPGFMRPDISGVLAYAEFQYAERARLVAKFQTAWTAFMDEAIRRDLALCVAAL